MLSINKYNRTVALRILSTSFNTNPGVRWVAKNDKHIDRRISVLCSFCLSVAMQKQGAFISSNKKGVALIFKSWLKQNPIQWLIGYIRLGNYCIGWDRALTIINREREIVRRRPKEKHLYFWMLAVEDYSFGLNTIIEIRDFVFKYSREQQLPIYAETTVEIMLTLYKRYGFKVYDEWETGQNGLKVYFISRAWNV